MACSSGAFIWQNQSNKETKRHKEWNKEKEQWPKKKKTLKDTKNSLTLCDVMILWRHACVTSWFCERWKIVPFHLNQRIGNRTNTIKAKVNLLTILKTESWLDYFQSRTFRNGLIKSCLK